MSRLSALTSEDLSILKRLIHREKARGGNVPLQSVSEDAWTNREDHQAPECYVAKPQTSAGIPKLLPTDGTTGTGTDISGGAFDEPGKALCDIAQIATNPTTGDPELLIMDLPVEVYNIAPGDLSQDWIPVIRTKYGDWIACPIGEEIEVVTDYRVSGLTLQKKTRTVLAVPMGDESDWTTVHTGTDCDATGTA